MMKRVAMDKPNRAAMDGKDPRCPADAEALIEDCNSTFSAVVAEGEEL